MSGLREVRAFRNPVQAFCLELYAYSHQDRLMGMPLVVSPWAPGTRLVPFMELDDAAAQTLFNSLWDAGLRPMGDRGSTAELERLEAHLADFRRILAVRLGVVLP